MNVRYDKSKFTKIRKQPENISYLICQAGIVQVAGQKMETGQFPPNFVIKINIF
jgi:hypothetical protein